MRNYLYRLLKTLLVISVMVLISITTILAKPVAVLNFYDSATINDTVIYLRDIASVSSDFPEITQNLRDAIAGETAPSGNSRFITTNDLVLYRLSPEFRDIDIKVLENKRIVVKTVGITRKIGDYTAALHEYLSKHIDWKPDAWSVEIENPEETFKTLDLPLEVSFENSGAAKSATLLPRGHIQLQFVVKQKGRTIRIPIACRLKVAVPVAMAKHSISKGTVLDSNDIELRCVDLSGFGPEPFFKVDDLFGQRAVRTISQGSILYNRLLVPVPVVSKGDQLAIKVSKGNVVISVLAIARENGNSGQKIWVENATTHKLVHVIVKDKNTAIVL
jgi:flagella basal body P-ring formation protein FlgA